MSGTEDISKHQRKAGWSGLKVDTLARTCGKVRAGAIGGSSSATKLMATFSAVLYGTGCLVY